MFKCVKGDEFLKIQSVKKCYKSGSISKFAIENDLKNHISEIIFSRLQHYKTFFYINLTTAHEKNNQKKCYREIFKIHFRSLKIHNFLQFLIFSAAY